MADIRLIVTDLDGTFLFTHKDAHQENVRAIRLAQQQGIRVCACTGRSWTMCRSVIHQYEFDPLVITSGGAAIIDARTGEPLFLRTIAPTALLALLYSAWHTGIETMEVYCTDECASFGRGMEERALRAQVRNAVLAPEERENYKTYYDFLDLFYSVEYRSELVSLITRDRSGLMPERLAEIVEKLEAFHVTVSGGGCVDLVSAGCTKETAVQRLCRMLRIPRENVMAIGDQEHDIPMMRWAGVGVAMGQADALVKRAADIITADNRDAGVAKAIYEVAMGYSFD